MGHSLFDPFRGGCKTAIFFAFILRRENNQSLFSEGLLSV